MIFQKILNELFGHKHYPRFLRNEYRYNDVTQPNLVTDRWAIYVCKDCGREGYREEMPIESTTIWWHHT